MGVPFTTRLKLSEGLSLPPLPDFPGFVCEACTVRTALDRELSGRPSDLALLMLERMRQIDVIHAWSAGTHKQYQGKLRIVRRFEGRFGVSILSKTPIKRPGVGPAVTLMWAQQHYSIQVPQWKKKNFTDIGDSMAYSTVRSLRSAVSMFHKLDLQMAFPGKVYLDPSSRVLMGLGCSPTDELSYTLMASGMSRRLGDESKPSIALLARHVRALDRLLDQRFNDTQDPGLRRELARAGLANTLAWLAWLRASELFSLRWCDLDVTLPEDGPIHDLPPKVGVVQARLLEQTKTNRTKVADVVIAFQTGSGLTPGTWVLRLQSLMGLNNTTAKECTEQIFQHRSGTNWTSNYFRTTYLLPSLHDQRLAGDPNLRPYDGSPGNSLADKFWSMHSYRRGGRSHVSRRREGCARKATAEEVTEHGRWRSKRSSMDMPTAYNEWTIADRISITMLCM